MKVNDCRVGVVADWLISFAGAERVLKEIFTLFPKADVYSVIDFLNENDRDLLLGKKSHTTFIQNLPMAKHIYTKYLPLMPLAIEQFDLSEYDLVLSSSHAVAKGVLTGPDQLHISYVHSPMRYAWDLQNQYLKQVGFDRGVRGLCLRWLLHKLRIWDARTAAGVDHFIANSHYISRRIKKVYGRDSTVIYPPVQVGAFPMVENKDGYYLTASRLVPYKKIDLIVEAFSHMPDKKLIVIGDGSEMKRIKAKASLNTEILGYQSQMSLLKYMQKATAFVFAAEEDFGIAPVEAQACGTPVIAFGKGGALETIRPYGMSNPTGLFFNEQNYQSIIDAVMLFSSVKDKILPAYCHENALRFSDDIHRRSLYQLIENKWDIFTENKKVIF
ncbi:MULTISPECIES: glycosyltransferase family 4 protein [Serratia]|jgi:glycosyltransferase involved in cell wall biosynthesis|uniref:Glycosyltransferase family 4 protein n=1 Tax=Serratia liquefaciens TaxID=614 RepID=A0A515CXY6_SERLI|nr:glycosyltransferase family 4 protein [Serratia liquefaciens]MBI6163512.1 glycosyltransferase family 4 protein [Serratia liquefaciens]MBV0841056.1 glycosyltransferase family 4 protein [Serratia liquefaciens]QDL33025.1 glycosyltransferase family 4 protein [Serratia liquefaciens]HED2337216.1 glycosyltransferase family 4 protein [Serratia liquefaciens]